MPTVTRTWAFASDAEGLADAGVSGVVFGFLGTDGNPSGCVRFTQANKAQNVTERALRASTGQTWESWGVPAGATVTQVQVTAWSEKLVANTKLTSHTISARIVGAGGASVHSAGDLLAAVALGTTVDASWQAGAAGTARAVDSGSQASGTDVRLELEYAVVTSGGGGSASVDQRFDQVQLTITYSDAPPPEVDLSGAATGGGSAAGTAQVARRLAGGAAGAGGTTGATEVSRILGGPATGAGDAAGDLTIESGVELAGEATASGAAAGALEAERQLAGAGAGLGAGTGSLAVERRLSGPADGIGAAGGIVVVDRRFAGEAQGSGSGSGNLSTASIILLSGAAAGGGSPAVALSVARRMSGQLVADVALSSTLAVERLLRGSAFGAGGSAGWLGETAEAVPWRRKRIRYARHSRYSDWIDG